MLDDLVSLVSQTLTIEPPPNFSTKCACGDLVCRTTPPRKAAMLRAELDRMALRIAALEAAENQRLLIRVKSGPLVRELVSETTRAPTQAVEVPMAAA